MKAVLILVLVVLELVGCSSAGFDVAAPLERPDVVAVDAVDALELDAARDAVDALEAADVDALEALELDACAAPLEALCSSTVATLGGCKFLEASATCVPSGGWLDAVPAPCAVGQTVVRCIGAGVAGNPCRPDPSGGTVARKAVCK